MIRSSRRGRRFVCALLLVCFASPLEAGGSKADYERARQMGGRLRNKVRNERLREVWVDAHTLVYRKELAQGWQFLRVDARTGDELWRVERSEGTTWSSPVVWKNKVLCHTSINFLELSLSKKRPRVKKRRKVKMMMMKTMTMFLKPPTFQVPNRFLKILMTMRRRRKKMMIMVRWCRLIQM